MTSLQHIMSKDPARPAPRSARARVAAPGYAGRKRADLVRTRIPVLLAHAGMWVMSIAQPGNGQRTPMLRRVCEQLRTWHAQQADAPPLIVRTDGEYGHAAYASVIAAAGLHYLMRCVDYRRLLAHPAVQQVLRQGSALRVRETESKVEREVFDVPELTWTNSDQTTHVVTRLVVSRRQLAADETEPSVGFLHEGWVYELFTLNVSPQVCSAAEAVSLYLGRGLMERALGQEDRELPTDRWICSEAHGQDLFQRICQWLWNHRVVLGNAQLGLVPLRRVEWTVPVTAQAPTPLESLPVVSAKSAATERVAAPEPDAIPEPMREATSEPSDSTADEGGALTATSKPLLYGVDQFRWDEEGIVHCPAGHPMRAIEQRETRQGLRQRYQLAARVCSACEQQVACRGKEGPFTKGRRFDLVLSETVSIEARSTTATVASDPSDSAPAPQPAPEVTPEAPITRSATPRRLPRWQYDALLWIDVDASWARRTLRESLRGEQFEWQPAPPSTASAAAADAPMTRDQRARRSRTWTERVAKNDCPPDRLAATIRVTGVSRRLEEAITQAKDIGSRVRQILDAREKSGPPVATA